MPARLRRIWFVVTSHIGLRKSGAVKLRHDVRTCEYNDIHVLWNMIEKKQAQRLGGSGGKKRHFWNIRNWSMCCRGF